MIEPTRDYDYLTSLEYKKAFVRCQEKGWPEECNSIYQVAITNQGEWVLASFEDNPSVMVCSPTAKLDITYFD